MEENFSPVSPEMYEEKQTEEKPIKTAADRLRETVNMPDFGIPEIQTNDEIFKEAPTPLPLDIAHKLVDGAKIREGVGEQTAVAIENALTGIGAFGDQATLAFGQITSAVTGNTIAEDFMDTAVKNLEMRMEDMKYAEDSVGGIRNLIAQLAGGTVSMGELLLVSAATGGIGGYVQMGAQAFGEGAFNDMEKYKEEHGGSLKGYQPKNLDIAINAGNAFLQAVIEKKFGVSSPRFLTGLSRGLVEEGASGFLQESTQSALADLAEYIKGNKEVEGWLDDAEGWIRDGIVGAILQGGLGAATYNYAHNNAVKFYAKARAQAQGRETPNNEDTTFGKNIVNAKERGYASALTQEFKSAFDASTGEGQLQAKIANALKKAVETKELDLDTANETEMAQRIEQIATQETLNAMDFAREQNRAISDMELNNIVYKDGAIWLEGLTPEVGDKAVSYARVLAERQSGLAELKTRIDANTREIQQLKADLAEAKAQKQESRAQVLQARIDKQNAIAEKNRMQAQKLEAQTAKLEKQIAKQTETEEQRNEKRAELKNAVDTAKTLWSNATGGQHVQLELDNYKKENKLEIPEGEEQGVPYDETDFFNAILDELSTTRTDIDQSKTQHFFDTNSPIRQAVRKWLAETEQGKRLVADAKRANQEIQTAQKNLDEFEKPAETPKPIEEPKREVLAKVEPKPVVRTSLKKERAIKKTQTGITRKLDADSKFVKVIDKPSNVDFSDGKEYEDSSKRYLLNKVIIKEQDGNLYFKLTGGRYIPTSYVVIENYVNTDPYEIFSAQVEEGKEIGDHFDRAVQDFYKEKGLWSLAEPVKLRSWEEYMKDNGQVTAQPSAQVSEQIDESSLEQYDPRKQYNKYDMVSVRTQSGEHIGVWDGERMTLHETMEDAQDFIKNDTEREEADRQADERRATSQKEESEKQEKAFREGQGFVEMPYIIQLLKDNDMWESLSLREKGNFNAIGSVMFSNGRIVNAFGNENSKKGTKVTQNTLDTIQKLRDKLNQSKPEKYEGDTIEVDGKERTVYNSNGDRIAKSKEALTNFWRWFGDSKVVDEQGRPLVVYHGTHKIFDTFDKTKAKTGVGENVLGEGWYFTNNLDLAERYAFGITKAGRGIGENNVMSLYLRIENPAISAKTFTEENDGVIEKQTGKLESMGTIYMIPYDIQNAIKSVDNRGTYSSDTGNILKQGSISGKGDTTRGGYDEQLKRIILGEKSDLSTIQHEFAHYWIQNNFKWARSGLASQDWLRRWRDVEEWLGIEPQDRLLSKSASEKFAKAYERYILEGKVAPELQWAFEGFQKAYQDIYDDLEKEYFDLDEELAPEVVDWFNRNKEQSPKRLLQADEKKLEKALTLAAGGSVIEEAPENTVIMTEQNDKGQPVEYMGIKQSEVPAGDNLLVYADKTTASKLQQSAKRWLSDKVEVQQLTTLDTQATLQNFKDWIARDRQGAWNAMMNPDTRPIYRTYLYKAFAQEAMNDVNLAMELANIDMAKSVRELGQAIQALDIRNESGFDMIEIIRNLEKSKGELSEEELNNSIAESGVFDVELSEEEMNEIDSETECKL